MALATHMWLYDFMVFLIILYEMEKYTCMTDSEKLAHMGKVLQGKI